MDSANPNIPAQPYDLRTNTYSLENPQMRPWYQVEGADRALTNSGSVNPFLLFNKITGFFPDHRRYEGKLDLLQFIQRFADRFPEAHQSGIYARNFNAAQGRYLIEEATWWVGEHLMVCVRNYEFEKSILLLFSPVTNSPMLQAVSILAENCPLQRSRHQIHLITYQHNDYQLRPFEVKCPEIELDAHYPDGFSDLHTKLMDKLSTPDEKGLVMLHGKPGTGKTTYLRYLISILNKKVIYLPPDMADLLARPDFVSFLMEHPNTVLVIEDAERVVEQRGKNSSTAISNLLNLCDGMLADCLNIQVICTFNSMLVNVDKALLRKGRLIAGFEFTELPLEKTNRLLGTLYGVTVAIPMTIADIYHYNRNENNDPEIGKVIGFR
jgi:hypothetical protein